MYSFFLLHFTNMFFLFFNLACLHYYTHRLNILSLEMLYVVWKPNTKKSLRSFLLLPFLCLLCHLFITIIISSSCMLNIKLCYRELFLCLYLSAPQFRKCHVYISCQHPTPYNLTLLFYRFLVNFYSCSYLLPVNPKTALQETLLRIGCKNKKIS